MSNITEKVYVENNGWHLDKRVPVAIIIALVMQAIYFSYSYGQVEARVDNVEAQQEAVRAIPERLAKVETLLQEIRDSLRQSSTPYSR
jgi:uncharacterized membrane protein YukC